ncbi:GNAT family N-acetyltransferase [Kineosporia rhizophila]|uniref:GNAT family N-acetyltransferase n=1 Tax=Kineosporia TaxID=49184 RepID=UPI001E5F1A3D|nr:MULTISPECIES: GNAT family N-acetyltransferase [Kineosporia]MCE0536524.1 GNAT family N-acetyltransferase [Kineosporia rhizophila]
MTEVNDAVVADLPDLVHLRTQMFVAMGPTETVPGWPEHAERWFAALIGSTEHCIKVIRVEGRVVSGALGSLSRSQPSPSRPFGQDLYISNVCTLPEFRGRGYATAVFEAVLDWGRQLPPPVRARLFATAEGHGMYQRAGFVPNTWPVLGVDL